MELNDSRVPAWVFPQVSAALPAAALPAVGLSCSTVKSHGVQPVRLWPCNWFLVLGSCGFTVDVEHS